MRGNDQQLDHSVVRDVFKSNKRDSEEEEDVMPTDLKSASTFLADLKQKLDQWGFISKVCRFL